MSGFEHGNGVRQVGTRSNTDTAHFCRQSVRQVVTVQVQGRDHVIFGRTQQNLLQHGIGNGVFNDDVLAGVRVLELHPRTSIQQLGAKFVLGDFVAPIFEGTFGELHDVAFVHDGQRLAVVINHVLQRFAHQTLGALLGNRLDADTAIRIETDLLDTHFLFEELDDFFRFRRTGFPLDARVDVFGVLTEDGHVNVLRILHWAWHASEPAHWTQADIQIELLAQGHVQGANAAADWRGQRTFDRYDVVAYGFEGFFRQPGVLIVNLGRFFAGVNFHPGNFALAVVGLGNRRVDDFDHHRTDINADTITFDKRNDRIVRYIQ